MPEMTTEKYLMTTATSRRPVIYVGNFSPPITGQKFVNQKLADLLVQNGTPLKFLTSLPKRRKEDSFYKSAQVCRIICLPGQLLLARFMGSRHFVYSLLGGRSRIIDMINVSAARLLGYHLTLYHHSSQFAKARSKVMSIILAVAGRRTRHIMASPKMAEDIINTYGIDLDIAIIDNSAFVSQPAPSGPRERSSFRLGLLSNLSKSKGLDASIETFEALITTGCDCDLVLAGPATDRESKDRIATAKKNFPHRIHVLGSVSGEQKEQFFRDIDVFLFPSTHKHETQSLVVPEAQSYGCPVIVYDHGYVAENIPDKLAQCIIPADKAFADEAANLIRDWIDNPDLFSIAQNETDAHFRMRHQTASKAILSFAQALKKSPARQASEY